MFRDFDQILLDLGELGKYQLLVLVLLCIPACFLNAFCGFNMVFIAYTPALYWCRSANDSMHAFNNSTQNIAARNESECGCTDGWDYDQTYFSSTIITEWDLVCDWDLYPKLVISLFSGVSVVGCFFLSIVQDKWGRKMAFMLSVVLYTLGASVSLFMPNLLTFAVVRSIGQLPAISAWNIGYVWALEYVGPTKRTFASTMMCCVYALAEMLLALLAYLCRTHVQLGLVTSLPFVALLSYYWLIGESPRWLLSTGKVDRAKKVLKRIARWEGRKLNDAAMEELVHLQTGEETSNGIVHSSMGEGSKAQTGGSIVDLFRGPNLRKKTIIITTSWIANSIVYVSIGYNTENLGGNLYINFLLLAAIEAPAVLVNLVVLNRYGRILPLSFFMILSGTSSLLAVFGEGIADWFLILLTIVAKFGISISYAVIYQLAGELYPTVVRGIGTGFSSIVGALGSILMPYIIHSAKAYRMLPMVILGFLSVCGGILILFLPETLNQYLPETLDEAERYGVVGRKAFWSHVHRLRDIVRGRFSTNAKPTSV